MTKICSHCKTEKETTEFWTNKSSKGSAGFQSWCKICLMAKQKEHRLCNPGRCQTRDVHIQRKSNYGISKVQYVKLLRKQNGICAICQLPETPTKIMVLGNLHVDHDHNTGAIRGLLCKRCNTAMGLLDDDPAMLRKASEYLLANT